jgi:hypothetical protein
MLEIFSDGRVLAGRTGGPAHVDGTYIFPGKCCGDWGWFNGKPAGQQCVPGSPCRLIDADGVDLEATPAGANYFKSTRQFWAASLGDGTPIPKLRTNFGLSTPDLVPVAVDYGRDEICFLRSFSQGRGLSIYRGVEVVWEIDTPLAYPALQPPSLRDGIISFQTPTGPKQFDYINSQFIEPIERLTDWRITLRTPSVGLVLVERADGVIRVRRGDSAEGITINTLAFSMNALMVATSTLQVGWGITPGEEPQNMRKQLFNVNDLPTGIVPVPGYQPKQDLIQLRSSMEENINEMDRIISLLP